MLDKELEQKILYCDEVETDSTEEVLETLAEAYESTLEAFEVRYSF